MEMADIMDTAMMHMEMAMQIQRSHIETDMKPVPRGRRSQNLDLFQTLPKPQGQAGQQQQEEHEPGLVRVLSDVCLRRHWPTCCACAPIIIYKLI